MRVLPVPGRRTRTRVVAAALVACSAAACSGSHAASPRPTQPAHVDHRRPGAASPLQVMPAPYQLPTAVSREVVLPGPGGLMIAGGLTPSGASTDAVIALDPVTGATRPAGRLAEATHDAAGVALGGRMFVLGGGTVSSTPTIQAFSPGTQAAVVGRLSRARSDSNGVSAGPIGYLVGGYDGTIVDPQVLATTDGQHFRAAARLPVPVRYAGTAAVAGVIWVFGGQTATGRDGRHPAGRPGDRRGRRGRPPAAAGAGRGRDQPGRADLRRGRGDRAGNQPDRAPVRPGHVPGQRRGRTAGADRLRGRGGDRWRRVPDRRRGRHASGAHGDDVPAGDGRTDDAERGCVTVAGAGGEPRPAGAGLGSRGPARRRPDRRPSQQPAADRRPAGPDQMGVPAARRPRARPDVPPAGRRVLLPRREVHHRDAGRRPGHQRDLARHQQDRLPVRRAGRARCRARPPVQPGRRDAHPGRHHHLGRHQELPAGDHHTARAHRDAGHRPDDERLRARSASAVRQPERRVPDDQRALPGHRDQRRLGRRDVRWAAEWRGRRTRPGCCTRRTPTRYTPRGI